MNNEYPFIGAYADRVLVDERVVIIDSTRESTSNYASVQSGVSTFPSIHLRKSDAIVVGSLMLARPHIGDRGWYWTFHSLEETK